MDEELCCFASDWGTSASFYKYASPVPWGKCLQGSKKVCRGLLGILCCHHAASEGKRVLVLINAVVNSVD